MQQSIKKLEFLTSSADDLERLSDIRSMPVFSAQTLSFLSELSKEILRNPNTKQYPDLTAYAFWIRKASLSKIGEKYQNSHRIGRGISFHIAPSNVPVAFALSFVAGLLAGNACIVRLSNKQFTQVDIIVQAIRQLFENGYNKMSRYLILVRYEHDAGITQILSEMCDVRVVWGGDHTISEIRKAMLPTRSVELTFADRYSLAVIDSDSYLKMNAKGVAEAFYTDTYYSDQGACSSPRLVFWLGENILEAQERFWDALEDIVKERYIFHEIQCVDKIDAFCRLAMAHPEVRRNGTELLLRVLLPELYSDWIDYRANGGFFFEYRSKTLNDLTNILGKACQTIVCIGVEKESIRKLVIDSGVRGVDRIVSVGQSMELSLIWDGYDLVESMSRIVD